MKKTAIAAIAVLSIVAFAVLATAEERRCDNCMMKVADDSPYRMTATFDDGTVEHLCSLFCASIVRERAKEDGKNVELTVVDYNTGEELKAEDAVWVEGSDIKKMMSDEARVAFKDKASAEAFVEDNGGKIISFDEAYDHSVKEWRE